MHKPKMLVVSISVVMSENSGCVWVNITFLLIKLGKCEYARSERINWDM